MTSENILYIGNPKSIHDLKWISFFSTKNNYKTFLISEKNTYMGLTQSKEQELKDHQIILLPPINDFSLSNPLKTINSIFQLRKVIKKNNIDTVHCLFGSPQPIWLNFIPSKLKKIITTRGSDVLILIKGLKDKKSFTNSILFYLIKKGFVIADFITSTSQKQIEYINNHLKNSKIELIKTGVDIDKIKNHHSKYNFEIPINKKIVLSIRYIGEIYNMSYQLKAIDMLPLQFKKELTFVFIRGAQLQDSYYDKFVSDLKKIDNINYSILDDLSQNKIWALIKLSDLVYMVPKSDGTPNSALETMVAKTPLIMGNLNYNKELFDNVALIADLDSPNSLSRQIIKAIEAYPPSLIKNGFNNVYEFGNRKIEMNKLNEIYQLN